MGITYTLEVYLIKSSSYLILNRKYALSHFVCVCVGLSIGRRKKILHSAQKIIFLLFLESIEVVELVKRKKEEEKKKLRRDSPLISIIIEFRK